MFLRVSRLLLRVEELRTHFETPAGMVRAVDGVSLEVSAGETLALVGESGCGKSLTALSILRLVLPPGRIVGGRVLFRGRNLVELAEGEMRLIRGNRIAMVFQEPMTSLNPVLTIGQQIGEVLRLHQGLSGRGARERTVGLLRGVGIPAPEQRLREHPHELSGGMRQRVMIAMALACEPELLIADEPTTALDVTIQAQVLALLRELRQQSGLGVLFITHDLGVVAQIADHVAVMYAGRIVERAAVRELLSAPRHPYTRGLLEATPRLGAGSGGEVSDGGAGGRLRVIPGEVPAPLHRPSGCPFHPRCELGSGDLVCTSEEPALLPMGAGHACACWKAPGYAAAAARCSTPASGL